MNYLEWKLRLQKDIKELGDLHRATKKEMISAIESGIIFEGEESKDENLD